MRFIYKTIAAFICCSFLIACQSISPGLLASGEVSDRHLLLGRTLDNLEGYAKPWQLTDAQLDRMSAWLESHRHDWGRDYLSAPVSSASCLIKLVQSNGNVFQLGLLRVSGTLGAKLSISDKGGNLIKRESMDLSESEFTELKQILLQPA